MNTTITLTDDVDSSRHCSLDGPLHRIQLPDGESTVQRALEATEQDELVETNVKLLILHEGPTTRDSSNAIGLVLGQVGDDGVYTRIGYCDYSKRGRRPSSEPELLERARDS